MRIKVSPGGIHFVGQVRDLRLLLAVFAENRLTLSEYLRQRTH